MLTLGTLSAQHSWKAIEENEEGYNEEIFILAKQCTGSKALGLIDYENIIQGTHLCRHIFF